MRCPNCEAQVPEGEKFCPQCGVPVDAVTKCPHCGAALLPGEQFCGECGQEIKPSAPPPAFTPPTAKKRSPILWIVIVVAALLVLGCLAVCVVFVLIPSATPTPMPTSTATFTPSPSPTPTFTPTSTATFTPSPSPTPTFTPTPSPQTGLLFYEEDFTDPGDEWETDETDDVVYKIDNGTYSIEVRKKNWMAWNKIDEEFADFVLDFDAVLVEGDKYNAYGVLFRYQDKENRYELDINGNGSYTFGKEVDDEWTDIIDWTKSAAIKGVGQLNHIRLIAYGNTFTLYINDQFVDEFTDESFLNGNIAPAVTAYDDPPARATFDNIKIWDVELR